MKTEKFQTYLDENWIEEYSIKTFYLKYYKQQSLLKENYYTMEYLTLTLH